MFCHQVFSSQVLSLQAERQAKGPAELRTQRHELRDLLVVLPGILGSLQNSVVFQVNHRIFPILAGRLPLRATCAIAVTAAGAVVLSAGQANAALSLVTSRTVLNGIDFIVGLSLEPQIGRAHV